MCGHPTRRPRPISPEDDITEFYGRLLRATDNYTTVHPGLAAAEVSLYLEKLHDSLTGKRYPKAVKVLREFNTRVVRQREGGAHYQRLVREIHYMHNAILGAKNGLVVRDTDVAQRKSIADGDAAPAASTNQSRRLSRRTRCAADLAVRILSPADRERYREEWAAELADLPRRDQAPYAFRLLSRAWSLRRELNERPSKAPQVGLAVLVIVPGADAVVALAGLDWPAAVVGSCWMLGIGWVVSSEERTRNLVSIIKAARSKNSAADRKQSLKN